MMRFHVQRAKVHSSSSRLFVWKNHIMNQSMNRDSLNMLRTMTRFGSNIPHTNPSSSSTTHHNHNLNNNFNNNNNKNNENNNNSIHPTDQVLVGKKTNVSHNFPDFIEFWNRNTFRHVGYGFVATTVLSIVIPMTAMTPSSLSTTPIVYIPATILGIMTTFYWKIGLSDIHQTSHAILRNYPVLGHVRYIFETIRPEIRQYFIENDQEGKPFNRLHRTQIYQRSKNVDDTIPFGTRRNVYDVNHEWACHSMWPTTPTISSSSSLSSDQRFMIGTSTFGTTKPYHASIFNISGMSYGAISDHAILALNRGAQLGQFYHNTGEGGVSSFHLQGGGDIVWNVGTGYFGCGSGNGNNRIFESSIMKEVLQEANGRIKMIEIKLSQGAKPGHGGLLPKAKITKEIASARKLPYPPLDDCHSPSYHSSFRNVHELIHFISHVRDIADGIPVGIKLCVGNPIEIATLCQAIIEMGNGPDFITVDGAEGGTGAAPPEFSNSVGMPLEEGLVTVRNLLIGSNIKENIALNASGHIATGFAIIRTIALGANITSAARAFMLSLGCIQALKCNTNQCPTGVATLDPILMYGLDPSEKSIRVANFHHKTVKAASSIVHAMGKHHMDEITPDDIMRRVSANQVQTLQERFPLPEYGSLLHGTAPEKLQSIWDIANQHKKHSFSASMKTYPTAWMY
jgi:glutamate synthase domain-containing protein 2